MWIASHRRAVVLGSVVLLMAASVAVVLFSRSGGDYMLAHSEWTVIDIAPDQRTLTVQFQSGGCDSDNGRASVTESDSAVAIDIRHRVPRPSANLACTADARSPTVSVRLKQPLAGRRIDGGDAGTSLTLPGKMPRLVGYSPGDAMQIAGNLTRRIVLRGCCSQVVAQDPPPGAPVDVGPLDRVVLRFAG